MDGLAVATAVIQFIEFTSGLISKGVAIHSSAAGLTVDNHELQTITESLSQSNNEIHQSIARQRGRRQLTANERDLQHIAADCQVVADELLGVLDSLASKGPRSKWRSFRHALRATWNEGKVRSLEERLDRYRQQMTTNVLNSLRREAEKSIREQSSMRESVERIEELQRNSISVGDRFVRQIIDGEQWRRDLIQMIHEQGQGELQKTAKLTQFPNGRGPTPDAVIVQERRIRERILHKLEFRNMADRERRISKAHRQTFEWIFCDPKADSRPWSSFKGFLEGSSKRMYWITGKPGSGKSTLMKYIRHHPETRNMLKMWSGNKDVIHAAFYFWNSGSGMQMSVVGLLQTVLHDCLQQLPQFVQMVLPERWEAASLFDVDDFPWSWDELVQALKKLITEVCPEKKFFVMIDGLDEYSGNQAQLIEFITELAEDAENLKLCVASRPWNNFEDAFRGRPSLMLQDLSAADIEWYIRSKFASNEGFAEFQIRDPAGSKKLLETIAMKAEGVFLWVHLVVQSLLEGLTNGDGLRDLRRRLEELPPNLEDLYSNILENLDTAYLDHASQLFQIVRACDSPTLFRVALADLEDGERALQAPVELMSTGERSALCKNMKRKLTSRCRGLLDISSAVMQEQNDDEPENYQRVSEVTATNSFDLPQVGDADGEYQSASIAHLEVQYLHRSVRDYIQSSEIWSWLVSANEEHFDPHLSLLKSHLLELKSLQPGSLTAQGMGFHAFMAIKYAKRSLEIHTKEKKKHVKEVVLLLDEVDKAATLLTSSPAKRNSTFVDRSGILGDDHWSSFFISRVPNPSFMHMMGVCGVHQHLEMHLASSDLNEEESANTDTVDNDKMPLMVAALEGVPSVPQMRGYQDLFGPHFKVLKVLLQNGVDCHKLYHGRSAWDLATNAGYANVLELFEEYRGPPPRRRPSHGSGHSLNNGKDRNKSQASREPCREEDDSDNNSDTSTTAVAYGEVRRAPRGNTSDQPRRYMPSKATSSAARTDSDRPTRLERRPESGDNRSSSVANPRGAPQSTTYRSPPQPVRVRPPPPPRRSPPIQYYNSRSQSFHNPSQFYDDDIDEEDYYQYRTFNHGFDTHIPRPRHPISYWRETLPDTQPQYQSLDYSRPLYRTETRPLPFATMRPRSIPVAPYLSTESLPYASYRSGWPGAPTRTTRGGLGDMREYWY